MGAGTDTIERLLLKLELRDRLTPEEREGLAAAMHRPKPFEVGRELVEQGSKPDQSTLLLTGLVARTVTLRNGRRQITALHVPGDFVDLHSFLLPKMDHSVIALTDCSTSNIAHADLHRLMDRFPHLGRLLWLNTLIDGAVHRQWIVGMGRRSALGRMAHMLCEHYLRLKVVGLTDEHSFRLPLTQEQLADVLGLSSVHVNRTLRQLRTGHLVDWSRPRVTILDWEGLAEVADFDATYLQLVPAAV